jgi:hypothetical protein
MFFATRRKLLSRTVPLMGNSGTVGIEESKEEIEDEIRES